MKKLLLLAAPLALIACGDADDGAVDTEGAPGLSGTNPPVPPAPEDLAALRSEDCTAAAQFYFEALSSGEFERAALAWDDPVVDGARLKALLSSYPEPEIEWEEPMVAAGVGMPSCTVSGTLTNADRDAIEPQRGAVTFERVPEPETSDGQASRWRIESQTFIEPLQRAGRSDAS